MSTLKMCGTCQQLLIEDWPGLYRHTVEGANHNIVTVDAPVMYQDAYLLGLETALEFVKGERLMDHDAYLRDADDVLRYSVTKFEKDDLGYSLAIREAERVITRVIVGATA
jgi:hypothetical protein